MIRRTDGNHWLMIAQAAHARLSGDLARAWGNADVTALPDDDRLLTAIYHHDDGWEGWDATPEINPDSGVPRDFTEMPMSESTAIWKQSVQASAALSLDAGRWVSEHFRWLAKQAAAHRDSPEDQQSARAFISEQEKLFPATDPKPGRESGEPVTGLDWLQLFDRLSLRLCCDEPLSPGPIELPDGTGLRLRCSHPERPEFDPYPFAVDEIEFAVEGRRIPARVYASDADLQSELMHAPVVSLGRRISRRAGD